MNKIEIYTTSHGRRKACLTLPGYVGLKAGIIIFTDQGVILSLFLRLD